MCNTHIDDLPTGMCRQISSIKQPCFVLQLVRQFHRPRKGFFSATRMMNSDGIEHLIEHTPIEALENLLQNAHNLTQIPLPPENLLQQDPRHRIYCLTRTCHPRTMCPGPMCHPSSMSHPGIFHLTPSAVRIISVTANPNARRLPTLTTTCTKAR